MVRSKIKKHQKKPLIVICSEGGKKSSEYYYFRNYASRNIRIKFSTGNSTDPKGMLEDLKKFIINEDIKNEDECFIFLILDTDLSNKRINEIKEIVPECNKNEISIITSAPTFEIWFLMHYRKNNLQFKTSKKVKKELEKIIEKYKENMDIYGIIKDETNKAITFAKTIEQQVIKNNEDLFNKNPHSSIYKVIETINNIINKNI